jgi:Fungal Zn(2)-Cys(6) binuclear cluster domain
MSSIEAQPTPSTLTIEDTGNSHTRRPFSQPRPRPRPVLSCLRCRSRKIKCDRLVPCKQCTLTGHDRECSYNARPRPDGGPRKVNGSISRQDPTNASLADMGNSNPQAPIVLSTTSQGSPELEALITLQQRLQKLEQLCATHSRTPVKTLNHENVGREMGHPVPKVDGRLSIKTSGPRYHSESYKKSLLHHVSSTFTNGIEVCF